MALSPLPLVTCFYDPLHTKWCWIPLSWILLSLDHLWNPFVYIYKLTCIRIHTWSLGNMKSCPICCFFSVQLTSFVLAQSQKFQIWTLPFSSPSRGLILPFINSYSLISELSIWFLSPGLKRSSGIILYLHWGFEQLHWWLSKIIALSSDIQPSSFYSQIVKRKDDH